MFHLVSAFGVSIPKTFCYGLLGTKLEVQREVNELIFEAAVQNSEEDLAELVKIYRVSGQGTKDKPLGTRTAEFGGPFLEHDFFKVLKKM